MRLGSISDHFFRITQRKPKINLDSKTVTYDYHCFFYSQDAEFVFTIYDCDGEQNKIDANDLGDVLRGNRKWRI